MRGNCALGDQVVNLPTSELEAVGDCDPADSVQGQVVAPSSTQIIDQFTPYGVQRCPLKQLYQDEAVQASLEVATPLPISVMWTQWALPLPVAAWIYGAFRSLAIASR